MTFADLAEAYPDRITLNGDDYVVSEDITVPASHPLYVGPGVSVLFGPGISLDLMGSPIFAGTAKDPISLGPSSGSAWDGITTTGTGPFDVMTAHNISISGASVGLRVSGTGLSSWDLYVHDCTSTGVEIRQSTLDQSASITRADITGCRFYGLSIWESPSVSLDSVSIKSSTTGIRAFRGTVFASDVGIFNSTGNGIQLVDSHFHGDFVTLLTDRSTGFTTPAQVTTTNSTMVLSESRIGFANRGIQSLKDSTLSLDRTDIGPLNLQGIYIDSGSVDMTLGKVHDCAEGALYSFGSAVSIVGCSFERNGGGHSGTTASTILTINSTGRIERSAFPSRQKADVECYGTILTVSNSTLLPLGRSFMLGDSSTVTFGNSPPPSGIDYLDPFSRTRYMAFMTVKVSDHPGGVPHAGAIVDLRDRAGITISSATTRTDGTTPLIGYIVYTNNTIETRSRLPVTIYASAPGKIVSSMVLTRPSSEIEIVLFPPNDPPTLWLLSPDEGAIAGSSVKISGRVSDDIGVMALSVRFDTAGSFLMDIDIDPSGDFSTSVSLLDIGSGRHRMEIRAYDGAQFSSPSLVNITIMNPITTDSDLDGLTDRTEDRNGNSSVDPGETDPFDPDSDDDGLLDGIEDMNGNGGVDDNETDPLDPDTDSDFLLDGIEDSNGNGWVDDNETDPLDMDSDHDGIDDRDDRMPLDPDNIPSADASENDTKVLVLVTIVFLLALVMIYLLFIRIGPGQRGSGGNTAYRGRRGAPGEGER